MSADLLRVAMWSGPRNISTAMMRSWENRPDTVVVDEPLYAAYLASTGVDHPGRDKIVEQGETDWRRVVSFLTVSCPSAAIFYQKHMCHHLLPGMDLAWVSQLKNCFLIRDPAEVVSSYLEKRENPSLRELGFPQQLTLFRQVCQTDGVPPVIDAAQVLRAPEDTLRRLCDQLAIEFHENMLHWPPGRRESDGIWADHWYGSVEQTTGFMPYTKKPRPIPREYDQLLVEANQIYEELLAHQL